MITGTRIAATATGLLAASATSALAHLDPIEHANPMGHAHAFDAWHVIGTIGLVAFCAALIVVVAARFTLRNGLRYRAPVTRR